MNYWFLVGFVLATWIINILIGVWFNLASKDQLQEYKKAVVEQANNTLIFGIIAVLGIFLGSILGEVSQYIIFALAAIFVLISLIPYIVALISTTILTFAEGKQGLQWVMLLSRTVEVLSFVYLVYRMFSFFFIES